MADETINAAFEQQPDPVTPEEIGAFYKRLKATGVIKGRIGIFEPEIRPRNAAYVNREGVSGEVVAYLQVVQEGRWASRGLTAAEARYIAELLLAAAAEVH